MYHGDPTFYATSHTIKSGLLYAGIRLELRTGKKRTRDDEERRGISREFQATIQREWVRFATECIDQIHVYGFVLWSFHANRSAEHLKYPCTVRPSDLEKFEVKEDGTYDIGKTREGARRVFIHVVSSVMSDGTPTSACYSVYRDYRMIQQLEQTMILNERKRTTPRVLVEHVQGSLQTALQEDLTAGLGREETMLAYSSAMSDMDQLQMERLKRQQLQAELLNERYDMEVERKRLQRHSAHRTNAPVDADTYKEMMNAERGMDPASGVPTYQPYADPHDSNLFVSLPNNTRASNNIFVPPSSRGDIRECRNDLVDRIHECMGVPRSTRGNSGISAQVESDTNALDKTFLYIRHVLTRILNDVYSVYIKGEKEGSIPTEDVEWFFPGSVSLSNLKLLREHGFSVSSERLRVFLHEVFQLNETD